MAMFLHSCWKMGKHSPVQSQSHSAKYNHDNITEKSDYYVMLEDTTKKNITLHNIILY